MNIAEIAVVAIPCVAIGAFLGHTFLRGDTEARFNVSKPGDDAFTIARLTEDAERLRRAADHWKGYAAELYRETLALRKSIRQGRAENADLRIDIAAKAQRLAESGLQSSGGIDPTVSV